MEDRVMDFGELITGWDAIDRAVAHLNKLSEAVDHFDADTRKAFKRIADNLGKEYKVLEESNGRVSEGFSDLVKEYELLVASNKEGMQSFKKADDAAKSYARSIKALGEDLLAGAVPGLAQMHTYLNAAINDYDKLDAETKNMARSLLSELEALEQSGGNVEHIQNQILQLAQAWELVQRGEKHVRDVAESAAMQQDLFNSSLKRLTEVEQTASDSLNGLRTQLDAIIEDYKMLNAETRMTEGETLLGYVSELTVRYQQANQALQDALNPMKALKNEVVKAFTFEDRQLQLDQAIKQYVEDIKTIETQINELKLNPDLINFEATRERLLQQLALLEQGVGKRSKAVQDQIDSINNALVRLDVITQGSQIQASIAEFESLKANTETNLAKAREEAEAVGVSFNNIMNLNDLANKSMAELQQISSQLHGVYKNMNPAELSQYGDKILQTLLDVEGRLDSLKDKMNETLKPKDTPAAGSITALRQQISNLRKEIDDLPDINSALGVQKREELEALKERLAGIQEELRGTKNEVSALDKMRERLAKMRDKNTFMRSDEYAELSKLIDKEKEEAYLIKQSIQIRNQAAGSVKQMEAQLRVLKFQFDRLTPEIKEQREAQIEFMVGNEKVTMTVEALVSQMDALRTTLALNKEAFGDYTMNVGNYKNSFDGLTFSVVQVVRELPSLAINANTFFLAISNNIPMVIDEINRVRKAAAAAKKEVPSVFSVLKGAMKSGMFWLNVFMAVFFTLMSRGDKIFAKIKEWGIKLRDSDLEKTLHAINEEVKTGAKDFGNNYTSFLKLKQGYEQLKTKAEKQTWIKNHKNDFHDLGVSITKLDEAQNIFVEHSDKFVKALMRQALASVALKAAQTKLEGSFEEFLKGELSLENMQVHLEQAGYETGENFGEAAAKGYYNRAKQDLEEYDKQIMKQLTTPTVGGYASAGVNWELRYKSAPEDIKALRKAVSDYRTYTKHVKAATEATEEAFKILKSEDKYAAQHRDIIAEIGLKPSDQETRNTRNLVRDIGKFIDDTHLKVTKLYNDLREGAEPDKLVSEFLKIEHEYAEKGEQLRNIIDDVDRKILANTKALTQDQINKLEDIKGMTLSALTKLEEVYQRQRELWDADVNIRAANTMQKRTAAELEATRGNLESLYELRRRIIMSEMLKEINENRKLNERERVDEYLIIQKHNLRLLDLNKEYADDILRIRKNMNDVILQNMPELSPQAFKAELDNINVAFTQTFNDILAKAGINYAGVMDEYAEILGTSGQNAATEYLNGFIDSLESDDTKMALMAAFAKYQTDVNSANRENAEKNLNLAQELELSELPSGDSLMRTLTTMRHEIEDLELQLRLAEKGIIKLNETQMEILRNKINQSKQQLAVARLGAFEQYGLLGGFLANIAPGFFGTDQINALDKIKQQIIDSLNEILDAEIAIREKERELAKEKVDEAKRIYDQEVEARNNGFAHSVSTAKNELMLHKKTLERKQADLEKAERAKAAVDAASQASSLTTAVAGLWQAFAPLGLYGILAAAVATAGMFGAFIASKAKAAQLTSNYGKGGYEVLRGGRHSSGNDIDLGTTNRRGHRMRAEGGEGMAIFNRRSTAKYKSILPGLVKSINDGTYLSEYTSSINSIHNELHPSVNLNNIEQSLGTLISQGKRQVYENGNITVIIDGNKRRTIKRFN